jgi:hypothetical protein
LRNYRAQDVRRGSRTTPDAVPEHDQVPSGKAPALQGHQPYYFAGDCGHRIMAVVPQDAKIECVEDPLAD